jgi:hypothetical protein
MGVAVSPWHDLVGNHAKRDPLVHSDEAFAAAAIEATAPLDPSFRVGRLGAVSPCECKSLALCESDVGSRKASPQFESRKNRLRALVVERITNWHYFAQPQIQHRVISRAWETQL